MHGIRTPLLPTQLFGVEEATPAVMPKSGTRFASIEPVAEVVVELVDELELELELDAGAMGEIEEGAVEIDVELEV